MTTCILFGFLCVMMTGTLATSVERCEFKYEVIQKMVQMNKTLEARESEITVQNNEIRKLTDLVHKTLEEGENQRNAVKALEDKLETVNSQLEVLTARPAEACQTGKVSFDKAMYCTPETTPCKQSKVVEFTPAFDRTPSLMNAFSYLDVKNNAQFRARIEVTELTRQGVTLTVATWWDSSIYKAVVSWIACPQS